MAKASDHLGIVGSERPVPKTIGSEAFRVAPFDGSDGFRAVFRSDLSNMAGVEEFPLDGAVLDDLSESLGAVVRKEADLDGELGRIVREYRFGPGAEAAWTAAAQSAVRTARAALGHPARAQRCSICADPRAGVEMGREQFEALVARAIDSLPPELGQHMENVAVVVEDTSPDGRHLAGVFKGVPLTERRRYSGVAPDRITIFRQVICRHARSELEVEREVATTVIHEIAHHFGIDDPTLRALGW